DVHVQRPRVAAVRAAQPRRGAAREGAGRDPGSGVLLRRRAGASWRSELRARLHRVDCAVPTADAPASTPVMAQLWAIKVGESWCRGKPASGEHEAAR